MATIILHLKKSNIFYVETACLSGRPEMKFTIVSETELGAEIRYILVRFKGASVKTRHNLLSSVLLSSISGHVKQTAWLQIHFRTKT